MSDQNHKQTTIPSHHAAGEWVRTSDRLPGRIGEQTHLLMWSLEWATWIKGMATRVSGDACEWAYYDFADDKFYEFEQCPEYWMSPILPQL
jgi:hypothetical protein